MGPVCGSGLSISVSRTLSLVLFLSVPFLIATGPVAARPAVADWVPVWSETPFPARDLRVFTDRATSEVLSVRFENLERSLTGNLSVKNVRYLIAGAPGRTPGVAVKSARYHRVRGTHRIESLDGVPPAPDGAPSSSAVTRIMDAGILRNYQAYTLSVGTGIPVADSGGGSGEFWILDALELEISLGAPPSLTPEQRRQAEQYLPGLGDESELSSMEAQLLNPNIDSSYFATVPQGAPTPADRWASRLADALKVGPVYRMKVYEPGLYRLRPDDLRKATDAINGGGGGSAISDFVISDFDEWRLFRQGGEVPLLISHQGREPEALFHVDEPEGGHGEEVYWLLPKSARADSSQTTAPLRIGILPSPFPPSDPDETSSSIMARFEVTEAPITDYNPRLRPSSNASRWYWKSVRKGEVAALGLDLPRSYNPAPAEQVQVGVMYGFANPVGIVPAIELLINGTAGHVASAAANHGVANYQVPSALFRPGRNEVAARLVFPPDTPDGQPEVLIQKLIVSWRQALAETAVTTAPFQLDSGGTGPLLLQFASSLDEVPDQEAGSPTILFSSQGVRSWAMAPVSREPGHGFVFVDPIGAAGAIYRLYTAGEATVPAALEAVSSLLNPEDLAPADYLIVAPESFHSALQPLIERRRSNGFRVAVADPVAVFDRYNFGKRDAEAIRVFLGHALDDWPSPKLRYVLLAGEASDYRGDPRDLPAGAQRDIIPVFRGERYDSASGDHRYAAVAGSDPLVDLAVGRLPVASADELTSLVKKILAYEDAPIGNDDWLQRTDYVYDDNHEFPDAVEAVIARGQAPPGRPEHLRQSDYPYVPNYRVTGRKRSHEATGELLRRFSQGSAVMNFFGHGGPNLWSHERMLHIVDVPGMKNSPRLPFVTCASCDNAWLDFPMQAAGTSIGELLVKLPEGGAIALFGPVAGASPYEHQILVGALMEGLYRRDIRRVGDLVAYAKNIYYADARSASLLEQYVLLGDPALALRVPGLEKGLEVRPASPRAASAWSARLDIPAKGNEDVSTGSYSLRPLHGPGEVVTGLLRFEAARSSRSARIIGPALDAGSYSLTVKAGSDERLFAQLLEVRPSIDPSPAGFRQMASSGADASPALSVFPLEPFHSAVPITTMEQPLFTFRAVNNGTDKLSSLSGRVISADGETVAENEALGDLFPGASRVMSFPARRTFAEGETTVSLEIGSVESSGPILRQTFAFTASVPANLEFVPESAKAESKSGRFIAGETLFLKADLRNSGGAPARNVTLRARLNDPASGPELRTVNDLRSVAVEEILPGAVTTLMFRWEDSAPGADQRIYLIADTEPVGGGGPTSASIALSPVTLLPAQNFVLSDLELNRDSAVVRLGTTVTLGAAVREDGILPRGPVDLEFGLMDPFSGKTVVERRSVPALTQATTVSAEFLLDHPYQSAYAVVNSTREWEEATFEDNRSETSIASILPLTGSDKEPGSFELTLNGAGTENLLHVPGQGALLSDVFSAESNTTITTDVIVSAGVIDEREPRDHEHDGNWSVTMGRARAFSTEAVQDLMLRVPVTSNSPEMFYELFLGVASSPDPCESRGGSLEVRVEGEQDFRKVGFQPPPGHGMVQLPLGRYRVGDGALDIAVRPPAGEALIVYGVALRPIRGTIQSAIYDIADAVGQSGTLEFNISGLAPDSVTGAYRTGVISSDSSEIVWSDWQEGTGHTLDVDLNNSLFQWRCVLIPVTSGAILHDVKLVIK